jgi:hypothetical protein
MVELSGRRVPVLVKGISYLLFWHREETYTMQCPRRERERKEKEEERKKISLQHHRPVFHKDRPHSVAGIFKINHISFRAPAIMVTTFAFVPKLALYALGSILFRCACPGRLAASCFVNYPSCSSSISE